MKQKLDTPVTVTLSDIKTLVMLARILNWTPYEHVAQRYPPLNGDTLNPLRLLRLAIQDALDNEDIDYKEWLDQGPIIIDGNVVLFSPEGTITVGCQTLRKGVVEEIIKRWNEAQKPS